ncbi:EAL domain-containing protein [Butyrivibrio sp. WCE2006]|uniref:EAL domain-containing protein n=1 Tax=Butyrivibrio sp. WCE2006 TaxID=1410611 RepID=UPI00067862EF|nr:EAL domain-containing protein [Butyrivibrio sp. WCE2006]
MDKYTYSAEEMHFLENSKVPFAIYQFINKRVVTVVISQGFVELFGYEDLPRSEVYSLMNKNMYHRTHPDDMAVLGDAAYRFATEGGRYDVLYRSKKGNEYRIIHATGRHIYKENGVRLAFVFYMDQGAYIEDGKTSRDIFIGTAKKALEERSHDIRLNHDYLTGLPSMTYFFELAEEGCREIRSKGKTPAILFIDFNGMKVFNQKYGLEEGDRLLKDFSEKIIAMFSHENCCRFSADHFCIYSDEEAAHEGALKLIADDNSEDADRSMPLRIGMYIYDDENISISGACDRAKIACDSEKNNYSDKIYLFDNKMMTTIEEKRYVVENIDKAIREDWIKVYYQPVIRTTNGKVCHEEALARWIDPEKGFLNPSAFIPALEDTNMIYMLDLYVLESVLKKMKMQADDGLYVVPVSVNLSRADFYACDIVEEVRERVDASGISKDKIVIEITESAIADDIDYMINIIERLKLLGFNVWMDDYGSGYSSPVILQKVPFDLIKIDMDFVRQLEREEKTRIILTETIRMAMSLGLSTVAEGVETKEQADFLKNIGCNMLQGFYYSKPIPYEEIVERNKNGTAICYENPEESDYYERLGNVNLYDLSMTGTGEGQFRNYFDTWPMLMVECKNKRISIIRHNQYFKEFLRINFPDSYSKTEYDVADLLDGQGGYSLNAVLKCAKDGKKVVLEDITHDGKQIKLLIWRIAINPLTGSAAVMIAVLSSTEIDNNGYELESEARNSDTTHKITGEYKELLEENERLRKEAEANRKITELRESVSALLTNMPAMTFSKDINSGKYLACNQAFAEYAHKDSPEEVVGLTDFEIFDWDTAKHFVDDDKKAWAMNKPYIFFEDVHDAAGNMRRFQTTKLNFTDDTGRQCLLGLSQDVTDAMLIKHEYVERLAEAYNQANIDSLTGVKNKNAYQEEEKKLNLLIKEDKAPEFAITILDVNDLKKINDTKGHKAGDEYILDACRMICRIFKFSPVYRVGGDEFTVISQGDDYRDIEKLVESISEHNEKAITAGGIVIACGMSKFAKDPNVDAVFMRADKNMYDNKNNLKNR